MKKLLSFMKIHKKPIVKKDSNLSNSWLMNKLTVLKLEDIATDCGFVQRLRKLDPVSMLISFFMASLSSDYSRSNWALQLEGLFGLRISKQGIWNRLTGSYSRFLEQILLQALKLDLKSFSGLDLSQSLLDGFNRILINDSTTIALPDVLNSSFKGNHSRGKLKSLAKIQAVIDLKSDTFVHLELGDYAKNDQSASPDILSMIKPGDLVLRDLGYFVLDIIAKISKAQGLLISKLRYGLCLYHINGRKLDLVKLLKDNSALDTKILVGKDKIPLRLVASPVHQQIASQRRRKAKKDRDRRKNHSKDYYYLLGYDIHITNLNQDHYSSEVVHQIYRLRWRIETIFKSWKSHLKLKDNIHFNIKCADKVRIVIYSCLILSTLVQMGIYSRYCRAIYRKTKKYLSMIKVTQLLRRNPLLILQNKLYDTQMENFLLRHCCYEKRVKRKNFLEKMTLIKTLN